MFVIINLFVLVVFVVVVVFFRSKKNELGKRVNDRSIKHINIYHTFLFLFISNKKIHLNYGSSDNYK